ncbi:DUF2264 domain-containing protein [Flindersiella endophytica]
MIELPEPDLGLSPHTGWTRAHWEALADQTLLAVRPYASAGHALIDLPGPASGSGRWSDGLEGFARTFLLAAFRLGQARSDEHDLAAWYAEGLRAGTDPASPERWPTLDEKPQAKVECASIALALYETRDLIWAHLDDGTRQRVIGWMAQMINSPMPTNNWVWFQNITEAFLRTVGGPWDPADIERNVALTEQWYVADGWYSDGDHDQGGNRNFDYYSGWAMHFYPLWYHRMLGDAADPAMFETYRQRIRRFLDDAQHLVATNGSPVLQGRSLTYRYAMLVPFFAGALFDASPLPPGRTRRLASGVVRHFVDNGCFDERGLQPIGWHGAFTPMRQIYSGPGSPYWSSKAFAGLLLPPDHPVWTATEEPLELELHDVERTIAPAGWVVSGTKADGIVRLANHRSDKAKSGSLVEDDPVYARHAYSTHAAPDYGDPTAGAPYDSHVALVAPDGRPSHRRPFELLYVDGHVAVSRHRAHWPVSRNRFAAGPWVTTASVLHGPYEVRLARIDEAADLPASPDGVEYEPAAGPWQLRFGGWALADAEPLTRVLATGTASGVASTSRKDGLTSSVASISSGPFTAHLAGTIRANPLGHYSETPFLLTEAAAEPGRIYAALVTLTGNPNDAGPVRLQVDGGQVTISWPDGTSDEVRLDLPSTVA